jgi:DNA-binding NtrC family response regulator
MTTSVAMASMPNLGETPRADLLNLLIVDDERSVRDGCREVAQSLGFSTFAAEKAEHAYRVLEAQNIDVVLLDMRLPGGASGLEILQQIKSRKPDAEVIVITGYGTVQSAVQAMKLGAYDYVTKPFNLEELRLLLERVASHLKLASENRLLREKIKSKQGFGGIVGRSPEMEKLYRLIAKVSRSTHPVLVQGESGTGKELVARAIHFTGPFRDQPFIPVDCGSLVPTLIESELFGYVRGAFTGAVRSKEGLLSIAQGGTVFLDEIAELPVDLQSKLLRAIQEKEIRPVGSTKSVPINVRILAATNRDLELAVQDGKFRKDLYFRLNVVTLKIPPLRERKQDIPLLVAHFLEKLARSSGVQRDVSDEAMKLMLAHDWPGNVRELENCLERACALSSGPLLQVADLPTSVQNAQLHSSSGTLPTAKIVPIAELERQAILGTIDQLQGDKLMAAKLLGIGKTTLYRKLKEYASQD